MVLRGLHQHQWAHFCKVRTTYLMLEAVIWMVSMAEG
uniref:Uncharacterized protein n=1 Tax=Rhizophora mucronata TaxID=61149 RepID=A0A2P2QWL3_RHIMU